MNRKKLFEKYYKHPAHDYEISDTLSYTDDTGRKPDICFIYSGRNRGKSFEISSQLIADAYYLNKQFGYIRRYDATIFDIESYFADKEQFIKDMSDNTRCGVTRSKGKLFLYNLEEDKNGNMQKVLYEEIGYFFALSRQANYKSLQFPEVYNLIYEEVLTDGNYLNAEPEKLMNLYSTIRRNKTDFKMWLVSNTVSVVNPYSKAWGIYLAQNKAGDVRLSKLYLGSYGKDKEEEYLLIACHYLKDKNDITKEDLKKNRNRIKTSIASNKWDELVLYSTFDLTFIKKYSEILETVIFEYDDVMMQCNILEVPENLMEIYLDEEDEKTDRVKPSKIKMPIMYIRRKTTEPHRGTRIYTNNAERFGIGVSKGFTRIYKVDKFIELMLDRGWIAGADNLTMNDFYSIFNNLYNI